MTKTKERVFHLSIAAIAVAVTAAALGVIIHHEDKPSGAESVMQQGRKNSAPKSSIAATKPVKTSIGETKKTTSEHSVTQAKTTVSQHGTGSQTVVAKTPSKTVDTTPAQGSSSTPPPVSAGPPTVVVKAYGNGVSSSTVAHVEQLLTSNDVLAYDESRLGVDLQQTVTINLVNNSSAYQQLLNQNGMSAGQSASVSADTGGFTEGNNIAIPLYQNTADPDLINTLAHEMTHALLNQTGAVIPSWMNEGLAVSDGMTMQGRVQDPVAFQGYVRQMAENILGAVQAGQLIPLSDNESTILSGNSSYDIELQDWLAVSRLRIVDGENAVHSYISELASGASADTAFQQAFGQSVSAWNQNFTGWLQQLAAEKDTGVTLQIDVPSDYQGKFEFLQHGTQTWRGVTVKPGMNQVSVSPTGELTTSLALTAPMQDDSAPDDHTLYVDLNPTNPIHENGQVITDAGFAIDYHDGLYGFVDSWTTCANGKTIYASNPDLNGLKITSIEEEHPDATLSTLLNLF